MQIGELLRLMVAKGASDLHLKVLSRPVLRINGTLVMQEDLPLLTVEDIESIFEQVTVHEQRLAFTTEQELDFAYSIPGLARFRFNVMRQRGTLSLAIRIVPFKVPSIDELDLPLILKELVLKPR